MDLSSTEVSLQLEWQHLQRTVIEVGYLKNPIDHSLKEAFLTAIFGGRGGQR